MEPDHRQLEEVLQGALVAACARVAPQLARAVTALAAELGRELRRAEHARWAAVAPRRRRRRVGPITTWTADRAARRVPLFVIEQTGLDTKRKVVARYGAGATFTVGRPPPPALAGALQGVPAPAAAARARPPRLAEGLAALG